MLKRHAGFTAPISVEDLMRRLIDCVLIQHDSRGTNVLLRHPVHSPAPDRLPDGPRRSASRAPGAHRA